MDHYLALLHEINRAFDFFNHTFCNNTLKKPIILVSTTSNTSPPMYGWFGVKVWRKGDHHYDEINISAESFRTRKTHHILETLLHEMAHLKNHQNGICDCNIKTQYHRLEFKYAAESFGLIVSKGKTIGYGYTKLGRRAMDAICDLQPREEIYRIYRVG